MNGKRVLLDTNIVIPIMNQDTTLLQRIHGTGIYIPSIVLGELYYGVYHSGKITENLNKIASFRKRVATLSCDAITADLYGQIKQELQSKGSPIPENDIWIAAIARQHDLPLISRDAHFSAISVLNVEHW
jgi:tRNA(fMet)-specific endonuclease VapC